MFTWLKTQKDTKSVSYPTPQLTSSNPWSQPLLLVSSVSFQDILCSVSNFFYIDLSILYTLFCTLLFSFSNSMRSLHNTILIISFFFGRDSEFILSIASIGGYLGYFQYFTITLLQ